MMNQETGKNDGALSETPEMMECTLTSALTHASARAQATIYGALYCGEAELLTPETVELALDKEDTKHDSFMGMETTFTQVSDHLQPESIRRCSACGVRNPRVAWPSLATTGRPTP